MFYNVFYFRENYKEDKDLKDRAILNYILSINIISKL